MKQKKQHRFYRLKVSLEVEVVDACLSHLQPLDLPQRLDVLLPQPLHLLQVLCIRQGRLMKHRDKEFHPKNVLGSIPKQKGHQGACLVLPLCVCIRFSPQYNKAHTSQRP